MEYEIGDKVRLKPLTELPSKEILTSQIAWDWVWPSMNGMCGKLVTIHEFGRRGQEHFRIDEDGLSYYYPRLAVVDTEVENARILAEREEKKIAKEKALEHLVYKPNDVLRIAEEVFGSERTDMLTVTTDEKVYHITIHFPEVWITNEKGHKRLLKDLFVRVYVNIGDPMQEYKSSISLHGLRTTLFLKEMLSGYSHSHLHLNNYGQWQGFCLGGSSHIAMLVQNLRMSMSEEDWFLLFYSIKPYLEWESREGGPYFYMENLKYGKTIENSRIRAEIGKIMRDSPMEIWSLNNKLELIDNHPSFDKLLNERSSIRSTNFVSEKDVKELIERYEASLPEGALVFKDRKIEYKVESDVELSSPGGPISKDIKNSYVDIINQELNLFSKTFQYERYKRAQVREARII